MAVNEAVKLEEMTDEQIAAIKRRVETFAKSEEFFDKFVNHEKWDRGSKTMKSRRTIAPKVRKEDIVPAVEDIAPRPSKVAVETFAHSVDVYRDKVTYTAEDVLFGYDDIVKMCGDTLGEIAVQKLDYIKGAPFLKSACVVTFNTSYDATLSKTAIILQKNKAKPWKNGRYLAMVTPETLEAIRAELKQAGSYISEPTKEDIDSGLIGHYGRWDFAVCPSDLLIKNATTQYMVCLGRRANGLSPIDAATIDGVEIIHNALGTGVLLDADGNYTSDDNKQRGSVAMNINGLGAYVNDDLCVIRCEVSVNEVGASVVDQAQKSGFVSASPKAVFTFVVKDGTAAVSSPTITYKKQTSTGDTVTADNLVVGDTYYITISGNSKSKSLTLVANASNYVEVNLA